MNFFSENISTNIVILFPLKEGPLEMAKKEVSAINQTKLPTDAVACELFNLKPAGGAGDCLLPPQVTL